MTLTQRGARSGCSSIYEISRPFLTRLLYSLVHINAFVERKAQRALPYVKRSRARRVRMDSLVLVLVVTKSVRQ
jgi:hypothetical protein